MKNRGPEPSLNEIGGELVRLGNLLKSLAPQTPEEAPTVKLQDKQKKQDQAAARRQPKKRYSIGQLASELPALDRPSAERRLTQLSVRELLALGNILQVRLVSKGRKADLVGRLLWHLFDAERGGELLRTLFQQEERKDERVVFDADRQWFAHHQSELMRQYGEQFVAILESRVVDNDADFGKLAQRVYEKYGYRDVFMPWVGAPNDPLYVRSPRATRP